MPVPLENTSRPAPPLFTYAPSHTREILHDATKRAIDKSVNALTGLSVGNYDGRFLNSFPGRVQQLSNKDGLSYHIVGINRMNDLSIVGP